MTNPEDVISEEDYLVFPDHPKFSFKPADKVVGFDQWVCSGIWVPLEAKVSLLHSMRISWVLKSYRLYGLVIPVRCAGRKARTRCLWNAHPGARVGPSDHQ